MTIAQAGAIEPLVDLMRGGSAKAREQAVSALGCLAQNAENHVAIRNAGAIQPLVTGLVALMLGGNPAAREQTTRALQYLARADILEEELEELQQLFGDPLLVDLFILFEFVDLFTTSILLFELCDGLAIAVVLIYVTCLLGGFGGTVWVARAAIVHVARSARNAMVRAARGITAARAAWAARAAKTEAARAKASKAAEAARAVEAAKAAKAAKAAEAAKVTLAAKAAKAATVAEAAKAAKASKAAKAATAKADAEAAMAELKTIRENAMCCLCLSEPKTHLLLPCGHKCVCEDCVPLLSAPGATCPLCRVGVASTVRVYE